MLEAKQVKNTEVYKDLRRILRQFNSSAALRFIDIGVSFLNKWESKMKSQRLGKSSISLCLRILRALFNGAIAENRVEEMLCPFKKFNMKGYSNIETKKRAISKENIEKLKTANLSDKDHDFASAIFLFSFYTKGMNFVDISGLEKSDIKVTG